MTLKYLLLQRLQVFPYSSPQQPPAKLQQFITTLHFYKFNELINNMKTIQPIKVWNNGEVIEATIMDLYISYDNLKDRAVFYYSLLDSTTKILTSDKLEMDGTSYINWDNSNDGAYNYAASVLNIIITGEYIPPPVTLL